MLGLLLGCLAVYGAAKVQLKPDLSAGEILRYQIETRETSSGQVTTPVANPQAGSKSDESVSLLVNLKVIQVNVPKSGVAGPVRLQATYEKAQATGSENTPDSTVASATNIYSQLEGQLFEFTALPDGSMEDFKAPGDILANLTAANPALSWMTGVIFGRGTPMGGVSVGQKWRTQRPLSGVVPLSGVQWRMESTYLRDEACPPALITSSVSSEYANRCAAILTHFEIARSGSSDPTPPEYLKNGLRTSGSWTGSGESLDFVSIATGLLVRSTQTSTQDLDYQVTSASTGSSVHQVSHTTTRSEITLLSQQ